MSNQTHEILVQLAKSVPTSLENSITELISIIELESSSWIHTTGNHVPEQFVELTFEDKMSHYSQAERAKLKIAFAATLALRTPGKIEHENLPESILAFYPRSFELIANNLKEMCENPNNVISPLIRYTRFFFALTIPCAAEDFDLKDRIPFTSCVLAIVRERSLKSIFRYIHCKGAGVWFRSHTNVNFLDEFNEEGFDRYYLRIAELLLRRKYVRGLVSSSWFHDPQLLEVSPRLSYLQTRALERGAYSMRHSGSAVQTGFAISTSETRRQLNREGKYNPIMYSIVWGRKDLISWAKSFVLDEKNADFIARSGVDKSAFHRDS